MLRNIQTCEVTALAEKVCTDRDGSTGIIFALALVPLVMLMGISIDLSRGTSVERQLKLAADNAAVTAVSALVNKNADATSPDTVATQVFNANISGLGVTCPPTVKIDTSSGAATATVSCTGSMKTSFASFVGQGTLPVSVSSTATGKAAGTTNAGYSGAGGVMGSQNSWEDSSTAVAFPFHYGDPLPRNWSVTCPSNSQNWYNLLSDMGIEVNVSCYVPQFNYLNGADNFIYDVAIVAEGHQIRLTQYPLGNDTYPVSWWNGNITIDGVSHYNYYTDKSTYALSGTDFDTMVLANTKSPAVKASLFKTITAYLNGHGTEYTVYTPNYSLFINFGFGYGGAAIAIVANNAGQCVTPGGYWGKMLSGPADTDLSHFVVSGPYATAAEYSVANCLKTLPVRLTN